VTDGTNTTLVRRQLGRQLANLRTRARITQMQAADHIEIGRATLARLEAGDIGVRLKEVYVRDLLALYQATPTEHAELLGWTAQTRNSKVKPWWHDYTDPELPEWFALYLSLEAAASTLRQYEVELVPGLLQTPRYAEMLLRVPDGYLTEEKIERRVKIRVSRKSLLTQHAQPHLDVILNEAALHRRAGDDGVMAEQLRHLLDTTQQASVSVRILPYAAGIHAGMAAGGPFTLLDFPTDQTGQPLEPPFVYAESLTGALYLNKPDEIDAYRSVWEDIARRALAVPASRNLLSDALKELQR
jgi:transcriptional regulator with XRE-family HTH domain